MRNLLRFLYFLVIVFVIGYLVYELLLNDGVNNFLNYLESDAFSLLISRVIYHFVIISITVFIGSVIKFSIERAKKKDETRKKITVLDMLKSFTNYTVGIVVILVIGSLVGINITALLASAGILALVIGMGAQSLISDVIAGVFIVFEKSFNIGDVIVIEDFKGNVTEIGVRTTRLTDIGGDVLTISNSSIKKSINTSNHLSVTKCFVEIEYEESLERVEEVIKSNLLKIKSNIKSIRGDITYLGVNSLAASGIELLIIAECDEQNRVQASRDLNRELLLLFKKENINIPYNQLVVTEKK